LRENNYAGYNARLDAMYKKREQSEIEQIARDEEIEIPVNDALEDGILTHIPNQPNHQRAQCERWHVD
jgi:hypothetical protein